MSLDLQLVLAVQHFFLSSTWTVGIAVLLARWLIFVDLPIAGWFLASRKGSKRHAVLEAAWSAGLALAFTSLIASFVLRLRPFLETPDVALLIPPPWNTSFPSGHTATAVAIACAFWVADRRVGSVAIAVALFVALGRVAVGVHHPTDILGGVAVGIGSFLLVRLVHRAIHRHDIERSARTHHHA